MEYEKYIEKLGGIKYLKDCEGKVSSSYINKLQKTIGKQLPEDYKHFLLNYGLCCFNAEITCEAIKKEPEYLFPESLGIKNAEFWSPILETFFGENNNPQYESYDILKSYYFYENLTPQYLLPIMDDGTGNFVGIHLGENHYQKVYFWEHEAQWNAEDYLKQVGEPISEEAKYQNLFLLANTFTSFLGRCQLEEQ